MKFTNGGETVLARVPQPAPRPFCRAWTGPRGLSSSVRTRKSAALHAAPRYANTRTGRSIPCRFRRAHADQTRKGPRRHLLSAQGREAGALLKRKPASRRKGRPCGTPANSLECAGDSVVLFGRVGLRLGPMYRSMRMRGRRIDGIQLQRPAAAVDKVVICTGRHKYRIAPPHLPPKSELIRLGAHQDKPRTVYNFQELVQGRLRLQPDL